MSVKTPETPKQTLEVLSISEVPAVEPNRLGQYDTLVTYRVDPLHIFSVRIPGSNLTETQIKNAVIADYKKKKPLLGMKIEV